MSTTKELVIENQGGCCAACGNPLSHDTCLIDAHHIQPRSEGGLYVPENLQALDPWCHVLTHDNYTVRRAHLEDLKTALEARLQVQLLLNKFSNQVDAYNRRTDNLDPDMLKYLLDVIPELTAKYRERDRSCKRYIKDLVGIDPLMKAALGVRAVGDITVGYCAVYLKFHDPKNPLIGKHASGFWKYVGVHCAASERYVKGQKGGGNAKLRRVLFNMATAQVAKKGPYTSVYYAVKERYAQSDRHVRSRLKNNQWYEGPWSGAPACHRNGAALRAIIKHFLADYWYVGRELLGLPVEKCYAEQHLGHEGATIRPTERGWVY